MNPGMRQAIQIKMRPNPELSFTGSFSRNEEAKAISTNMLKLINRGFHGFSSTCSLYLRVTAIAVSKRITDASVILEQKRDTKKAAVNSQKAAFKPDWPPKRANLISEHLLFLITKFHSGRERNVH